MRCIKIFILTKSDENFLTSFVKKKAESFKLEGIARKVDKGSYDILVCGDDDSLDFFLDELYRGTKSFKPDFLEVEAFLKDRDFRGVFRVIE
jgi:acylphosphatase